MVRSIVVAVDFGQSHSGLISVLHSRPVAVVENTRATAVSVQT